MIFEIAVVAVRLLGVYLIVGLGMPAVMAVGGLLSVFFRSPNMIAAMPQLMWTYATILMPLIVGVVMILMSRTVAGWVTPASAIGVVKQPSAPTEEGILRVGTLLIALWLGAMAIVDLVIALLPGPQLGMLGAMTGKNIIAVLVQFGVAGGLFMLARK